ncbi:type VI secretion system-associated protein TagF [Hahella sp. NBU794]|uniref:type VI secretion system-associated protein TagF n=1 Tax=Hahella sp. NBU794 TaxID=3422590 RepID=UPI003D6DE93F
MNNSSIGYFGKLPSSGDFIQLNLPGGFGSAWDKWLQNSLYASQQSLGQRWLDYYLVAPWWRFMIMPKVLDEQAWIGLWCPSVDSVGRYFPFTVLHPLSSRISYVDTLLSNGEWYETLETLIGRLLEQIIDFGEFRSELAAMTPPLEKPLAGGSIQSLSLEIPEEDESTFPVAIGALDVMLMKQEEPHSFWWTQGSTWVSPRFVTAERLPKFQGFTAFLDGKWQQWGWNDR